MSRRGNRRPRSEKRSLPHLITALHVARGFRVTRAHACLYGLQDSLSDEDFRMEVSFLSPRTLRADKAHRNFERLDSQSGRSSLPGALAISLPSERLLSKNTAELQIGTLSAVFDCQAN